MWCILPAFLKNVENRPCCLWLYPCCRLSASGAWPASTHGQPACTTPPSMHHSSNILQNCQHLLYCVCFSLLCVIIAVWLSHLPCPSDWTGQTEHYAITHEVASCRPTPTEFPRDNTPFWEILSEFSSAPKEYCHRPCCCRRIDPCPGNHFTVSSRHCRSIFA